MKKKRRESFAAPLAYLCPCIGSRVQDVGILFVLEGMHGFLDSQQLLVKELGIFLRFVRKARFPADQVGKVYGALKNVRSVFEALCKQEKRHPWGKDFIPKLCVVGIVIILVVHSSWDAEEGQWDLESRVD